MKKEKIYKEQGRSMVEMLGVLAVIGVLSVGGIVGYSNTMRNHRANEVLNATSTLYVMGMVQNAGNGTDMNYTSIGTAPSGTSELAYNNTTKAITITFTDAELCSLVKSKLGDKAGECNEGSLTVNFGETSGPSEAVEDEPIEISCNQDSDCQSLFRNGRCDGDNPTAFYCYCGEGLCSNSDRL